MAKRWRRFSILLAALACALPSTAASRPATDRLFHIERSDALRHMSSWAHVWVTRFDADRAGAPECWVMNRWRVDCRLRFFRGSRRYCFGIWKVTEEGRGPTRNTATFYATWRDGTCRMR
jgi:hypothetical protein